MKIWQGKSGPLLIAEIGGNHEGNFDYALELTKLAIEAGVDYIKYQVYTGDSIVNPIESPQRNSHFKKFELNQAHHEELANLCQKSEVGYMASVWDIDAFNWIDQFITIYKIGSGDITALPFLKKVISTGKPMIISTGLSTEGELLDVLGFIQKLDSRYQHADYLAILQCTTMYPIKIADANLNVIPCLKSLTGLTVGYSDHTEGTLALETAVAMGAEVLEFHFTDKREGKSFRDHKVSLTKEEVIQLRQRIGQIIELKGDGIKDVLQIEKDNLDSFRRAVYPAQDIPKETIIAENMLTCLRPNHGIDARDYYKLIGKTSNQALSKYQKLDWRFFN